MPYIAPYQRKQVTESHSPENVGELNFLISKLVHSYLERNGGVSYTALNAVIGVLECAKLECYRMLAAPYEDKKALENGPVSVLDKDTRS